MKAAVSTLLFAAAASANVAKPTRHNEVWTRAQEDAAGIQREHIVSAAPHTILAEAAIPETFTWGDVDGVNYLTMSRNQHLPAYCGSCWAHGAVSALADRIKIQRKAQGVDINLSVQHILNCGNAGSCHGGSVVGPYAWIHQITKRTGSGVSYETSNPYQACSSESTEGLCKYGDFTCSSNNLRAVAYTCSTFTANGGFCAPLSHYPNATIAEYGTVTGVRQMKAEIFARGPISCGIDANPLTEYTGGIISKKSFTTDHVVSVVGWGKEGNQDYWIVRNSWGEYWGLQGYVKVAFGALNLEEQCAWATPGTFTTENYACYEDGSNCK